MKSFPAKSGPFNCFLALWTRPKLKGLSMLKIMMYRYKVTHFFFLNFECIKFYGAKDYFNRPPSLTKK